MMEIEHDASILHMADKKSVIYDLLFNKSNIVE